MAVNQRRSNVSWRHDGGDLALRQGAITIARAITERIRVAGSTGSEDAEESFGRAVDEAWAVLENAHSLLGVGSLKGLLFARESDYTIPRFLEVNEGVQQGDRLGSNLFASVRLPDLIRPNLVVDALTKVVAIRVYIFHWLSQWKSSELTKVCLEARILTQPESPSTTSLDRLADTRRVLAPISPLWTRVLCSCCSAAYPYSASGGT